MKKPGGGEGDEPASLGRPGAIARRACGTENPRSGSRVQSDMNSASEKIGARLIFKGQCHCGAIGVELMSDRAPAEQALGACQCAFCRKHNARAFSDPKAHVTLTAVDPEQLQRYMFGLRTSEQIICRRCGVYVAMTLMDGDRVWSVINVDTLEDRVRFTRAPEARDYSAEDRERRVARRKARWCPTTLIGWPALAPR